MRRIHFKNTYNTRDIGGILNRKGQRITEKKIIRSDLPHVIEEAEKSYLLEKNINTVIDLRKPDDISNKPNALDIPSFQYFNVPLRGDKAPEKESQIASGYIEIIDDKESIHQVMTLIAEASGGVIINCNAGKDRTGAISMLLLLLAEADESDILVDYQVSYTFLREKIREIHQMYPNVPPFFGQSKMEYMEETLELFKIKYENIDKYFDYIQLDAGKKEKIKAKLLMD